MKKNKYDVILSLVTGVLISLNSAYSLEAKTIQSAHDWVVSTSQSNISIWDQLRAEFNLNISYSNAEIISQRDRYLSNDYELDVILERATPYLYFISQEIKKRNLPAELILLPLIESEYDPKAISHKSAAGLWQLMPSTGRVLGLTQNNSYDGRHDIYTSTKAALNHLSYLNKKFDGDWLITLAAYNAGEGTIGRVIERNRAAGKPTDYWSLEIPYAETRLYVQRFLALIDIIENADAYNFELPAIPNRPALILVKLSEQTNLNYVSEVTGMNLEELYKHNPGINPSMESTPPNGPHHLLIPVGKAHPRNIARLNNTNAPLA